MRLDPDTVQTIVVLFEMDMGLHDYCVGEARVRELLASIQDGLENESASVHKAN